MSQPVEQPDGRSYEFHARATMDYQRATAYLDSLANLERGAQDHSARSVLTLQSVQALAVRLKNPERRFRSIHVAGTKGKGSTCAMAAAILQAHGLRVGLYTSPHLEDLRERIAVDGVPIPPSDFAQLMDCLRPHIEIEALRDDPGGTRSPTYFEVLTHLAFLWFAECQVDAAVVEVGLGGRLDATNILRPEVSGIASISLDHTAILGDTLSAIAGEKAGIFKRGVPAFSVPQQPEAAAVLRASAWAAETPLTFLARGESFGFQSEQSAESHMAWNFPCGWVRLHDGATLSARVALRGAHQVENWALAVRLAETFLSAQGRRLDPEAVRSGSAAVCWPGRLEEFRVGTIPVFLDGAHNAASLRTVITALRENLAERRPFICVFGCGRDKDIDGMLKVLAEPGCEPDRLLFTDSANPRSALPEELEAAWRGSGPARTCESDANCTETLRKALAASGDGGVVLVAGSLYLVGMLRPILRELSEGGR